MSLLIIVMLIPAVNTVGIFPANNTSSQQKSCTSFEKSGSVKFNAIIGSLESLIEGRKHLVLETETSSMPPSQGKWVINETVIIENKSLIINGSIVVRENGSLILRNSELYMNLSYNGEFRIDVLDGGNLTLINSKITAYNPQYNYYIRVFGGAKLRVESSEISFAGYKLGDRAGVLIRTENVLIRDSIIRNCWYGLLIERATNITIENTTIANCSMYGIYILTSNSMVIKNSHIARNSYGIMLDGSVNISILGCDFVNNTYYGLYLFKSENNTVTNNTFKNCGLFVYSSYLNRVERNKVNNKPLIYLENISDIKIDDAGQVILLRCENISIENCSLLRSSVGIEIWQSNKIVILNNHLENNSVAGLIIWGSSNVLVEKNIISRNLCGLEVKSSYSIMLAHNSVSSNKYFGLHIQTSQDATIYDNNISRHMYGLIVDISHDVYVYLNSFDNDKNALVKESYKVFFYSIWKIEYNYKGKTFFGCLGNYWSNYTGIDTDDDGVSEADCCGCDSYPLVSPAYMYNIVLEPSQIIDDWYPKWLLWKKTLIEGKNVTFGVKLKVAANVTWFINGTAIKKCFDLCESNITYRFNVGTWNVTLLVIWNGSKLSISWEITVVREATFNFYIPILSVLAIPAVVGLIYFVHSQQKKKNYMSVFKYRFLVTS